MTINESHSNLVRVLTHGRIVLNGAPLTLIELDSLMQSERMLFDAAKELAETRESQKNDVGQKLSKLGCVAGKKSETLKEKN